MGDAAVPDIEKALDLMVERESRGQYLPNAWLLLNAYARIKGPGAYPRLRALLDDRRLESLRVGLDDATAVSFGLTSYVAHRPWTEVGFDYGGPCGFPKPQSTLDQSILAFLAWQGNARLAFERTLGPRAEAALTSMLNGRTWEALRTELWHGKARSAAAVGYRWSGPEANLTLPPALFPGTPKGSTDALSPEIDTQFVTAAGAGCGSHRIKFSVAGDGGPFSRLRFVVDSPDIEDLLRLIASCASQ
jgi:hypothetical protein